MRRPATVPHRRLPGDGPRHRGPLAALRARRRPWMSWVAAAVVTGPAFVVAAALQSVHGGFGLGLLVIVLFLAFPTCLVVGVSRRWHERFDRTDDDVLRYSSGVAARLELDEPMHSPEDPTGRLWLDGREVGRFDLGDGPAEAPPTLSVSGEASVLEMRTEVGGAALVVRLGGIEVRGEHREGRVDWAFPVSPPEGGLRLRQRLAAIPTRRTLTGEDGSAWLVRADHAASRWTGELPVGTTALHAALVLWTCAALDQVGVEHCYPVRRGLAVPAPPPGWRRVGGRVRRPDPPEPPSG